VNKKGSPEDKPCGEGGGEKEERWADPKGLKQEDEMMSCLSTIRLFQLPCWYILKRSTRCKDTT
jgi:hypothetical protein